MKLREYQTPQVNKLIRQLQNSNEAALISAVGTGKTLVGAVVGDELIKRGIVKKVIVSAPFNTIVKEFPEYSGKKILSGSANNSQYLIGKIEQSPNIKTLIDVITGNSSEFVSTSHHAMANHRVRTAVNQADDLSDLLLIIDEAHHCFTSDDEDEDKDGTLLGEIAEKIKDRGGKIMYVTATPYRTVGAQTNLIFDPLKCNPVIRTIGEQMRDGYAPSLNTEYIHVRDVKLTNAGDGGVFGDLANTRISDPQLKTLLPRIVKQWRSEKYPKTILLVPAGNADHTAVEVKKYLEEIIFPHDVAKTRGRKHPSVLISVGDSGQTIEVNGKEMTEIECDKASGGRVYDIVIGCRKFDEGTDVSSASHIFMVGLPSSVRLFHQRTGRVLRDKKAITGYAEWFGSEWLDKSKVVFFAPVGKKTKAFDYKVGRQLLHCIFAAESYQEYCESLNASQNIRIAFENKHKKAKCEASREELEYAMALMGEIELNELKDYSSNEFDELVKESLNPEMTVGERIDLIKSSDMTDAERVIALNNIVNHLPDDIKQSINWDAIVNSIVKLVKNKKVAGFDVPPTSAISDVFDDVLREFYSVTITTNTERAVQQVFSSLSGETFKEWAEKCSQFMGEDNAIHMCNQVIEHYNKHGHLPPSGSTKLGSWILTMRGAKSGRNSSVWYPILDTMADTANIPELFNNIDRESIALKTCNEVVEFYTVNKRVPINGSPDEHEAKLSRWIGSMKKANNGKTSGNILYQSVINMASDAGLSTLFDNNDNELYALDMCQKVIDYICKHGTPPPANTSSNEPKHKLGNWLSRMKSARKGTTTSNLYPSVIEMANNAGHPTLFEKIDRESISLDRCRELITYVRKHNKLPSKNDIDSNAKSLYLWLSNYRVKYKNSTDYKLVTDMFIREKMMYAIEPTDAETDALNMADEVIAYWNTHHKLPGKKVGSPNVRRLGTWIDRLTSAKHNNSSKGVVFYPSVERKMMDAGLPSDMFVHGKGERRAIDKCKSLISYYNDCNAIPSATSNDPKIRSLGVWLSNMRASKNGNGKLILHKSVISLLERANLLFLLDPMR